MSTIELTKELSEMLEYVEWKIGSEAERVDLQREMRGAFMLNWDFAVANEPGNAWMLKVVDPAPCNDLQAMANILANKEPRITVKIPREAITETFFDKANAVAVAWWNRLPAALRQLAEPKTPIEKLQEMYENVLRTSFRQNDARRDGTLRHSLVLDGFITGQMALKCTDLRYIHQWQGREVDLEGQSPFLIDLVDPTSLYTERDSYGLSCVIHRYVRPMREVKAVWGKHIEGLPLEDLKDFKNDVLFCEYWKRDIDSDGKFKYSKAAWIERISPTYISIDERIENTAWIVDDEGAVIQENTYGFIPYSVKTCRKVGDQVIPTLYAAVKSGMNHASNAAWTLSISMAIKFALAQAVLEGWRKGEPPPELDYTKSNIIPIETGQTLSYLEQPNTAEIDKAIAKVQQKMQESTIPTTLFGNYPSGAPASAYALSVKTGAQIIEPIREAYKEAMGDAARQIFKYIGGYEHFDSDARDLVIWMESGRTIITPDEIPSWMDIAVELEPDLPADEIALLTIGEKVWSSGWLPWEKSLEIGKIEDINEVKRQMKDEKGTDKNPRGGPPQQGGGLPASILPPNQAKGFPIESNPSIPSPTQQESAVVTNPMKRMNG